MEKKNNFWPYAAFILLSLLTGGLATLVSVDGMRAFGNLQQSPLTPPPVVFSLVWAPGSSSAASGRLGACGALRRRSLRSIMLHPLIKPRRTLNPVAIPIKTE